MRSHSVLALRLFALLWLAACASMPVRQQARAPFSPLCDTLWDTELRSAPSLYAAIDAARPFWLAGFQAAQSVFVGDVWIGDASQLHYYPLSGVASVCRLDVAATATLWGGRYRGPALVIVMR